MKVYNTDLAYIHDVAHTDFARDAAPGLLAILRKHGIRKGTVVDLGCGSGVWARELVDAGYDVLGIDISAAMIALARKRVPEATFRAGSFLHSALPPCDAVTSLGECFNYLFDRGNGPAALRKLFKRIHTALRPGGVLVFDIAEPGRGTPPRTIFREGKDWAMVAAIAEDAKRKRLTRRIATFRVAPPSRRPGGRQDASATFRRTDEVHHLQLYPADEMANELRNAGFQVRVIDGYGRAKFPPAYRGFIAQKL